MGYHGFLWAVNLKAYHKVVSCTYIQPNTGVFACSVRYTQEDMKYLRECGFVKSQKTCKPGSVPYADYIHNLRKEMAIPLRYLLPSTSSNLPELRCKNPP